MSLCYQGIELELPAGRVALSHSVSLDMILGRSSTQNMDWTDVLSALPWGSLKAVCRDEYVRAGTLFSLLHLDYQVCNGGIAQYFYNGYDQARDACTEHDVERYDLETQKEAFLDLVNFGRALFPARQEENEALSYAAESFQQLFYERDAQVSETVYCDEEPTIFDEDLGDYVENPDYFEPYEEAVCEDVIHGDENFDDTFYKANEYMEELMELSAQHLCKSMARDLDKYVVEHPDVAKTLKESLPASAFRKPSLSAQLNTAASKSGSVDQGDLAYVKDPSHER